LYHFYNVILALTLAWFVGSHTTKQTSLVRISTSPKFQTMD
jgi:hypothetical protein